jgi:histidinol phosphatase-like PHP family hydrolase
MKCPLYDFHIHTKYLGCANATMEIPSIIRECEKLGVTSLAITDHLNTFDQLGQHALILKDIQRLDTNIEVFFGVELNYSGYDREFVFNQEIKEKYGFQFSIGGIHSAYLKEYDLKNLIDIQHKHHIKTCRNPLVQVLVHPYWFSDGEFEENGWPWFNSMKVVPEEYVRELAQIAKETNTAIEINAKANLDNPKFSKDYVKEYFDFLSILNEERVVFSLASDAHDIGHLPSIKHAWRAAERLGLSEDRIWRPGCKPIKQC